MDYFPKLIALANGIKDKALRAKVVGLLKNPGLSNKGFPYEAIPLRDAPASLGFHHTEKGGLAKHTYVVASLSLAIADVMEENYSRIDRDVLTAGALLHDIAKVFDMKRSGDGFGTTDLSIDHIIMGSAELYSRGFPESVIHLIASHFGEQGTTSPQSIEAVILHYADTISAVAGTSKAHRLLQLLGEQ